MITPAQTVGPYFSIGLPWEDGPVVVPDGDGVAPGVVVVVVASASRASASKSIGDVPGGTRSGEIETADGWPPVRYAADQLSTLAA